MILKPDSAAMDAARKELGPMFARAADVIHSHTDELDTIRADLAANRDKAHQANNEAFVRAMREQIQRNPELRGIA